MKINWDRVVSLSMTLVVVVMFVFFFVGKGDDSSLALKKLSEENKILEDKVESCELIIAETDAQRDGKQTTEVSELDEMQQKEMALYKLSTSEDLFVFSNNGHGILVGHLHISEADKVIDEINGLGLVDISHIVMKGDAFQGFKKVLLTFKPSYIFYNGMAILDENTNLAINELMESGKLVLPLFTPGSYDGDKIRSEVESSYKFDDLGNINELLINLNDSNGIDCKIKFMGGELNL